MRCPPGRRYFPPWRTHQEWMDISRTVDLLIEKERPRLGVAFRSAEAVYTSLKMLFPLMDDLCSTTCRFCPSPCCLNAKAYFDYRDVLFLKLNNIEFPPRQTLGGQYAVCHYLGHRGCRLPRRRRPWICTWYLCPSQTQRIRRLAAENDSTIEKTMNIIGQRRKEMGSLFTAAAGGVSISR